MRIAGGVVRRWGGRAVGLAITGVGLYIVAPSLLSLFGTWPRLADIEPWWFPVLAGCVLAVGLAATLIVVRKRRGRR